MRPEPSLALCTFPVQSQTLLLKRATHMASARSYIFEGGPLVLLRNTASIAVHFFGPLWLVATAFVLPVSFLSDIVSSQINSLLSLLLAAMATSVAVYFACFVIVGEVSDICLGGTASFSKAMYKTSVKGVGRLLGTDMLVVFLVMIEIVFLFGILVLAVINDIISIEMLALGVVVSFIVVALTISLFIFNTQVVAIERQYWFSALRRSASIFAGSKLRSMAIAVVLVLIYCFSIIISLFAEWLAIGAPPPDNTLELLERLGATTFLKSAADSITLVAFLPIPNIYLTLAYYHLRRTEGQLSAGELADIKAYEMS
jgi:hypothetical protein